MAKADAEQARENQFAQRLKQYGYEVTMGAKVKGSSGNEHGFSMLAHKDDGLFSYDVIVGLAVSQHEEVGLGAIFSFDEKATDASIPDKVLIAIPKLGAMATNFARQQHVKVFDEASLTAFLNSSSPPAAKHNKPIEFNSKAQLLKSLAEHGYKFDEQVKVKGVSGAEYTFDILAYIDSDIITHPVSIDFLSAEDEVGMEPMYLLDAKAHDTGIIRSVLVASPKLSDEARQFAREQQIKVFELGKAPAQKSTAELPAHKKAAAQTTRESSAPKVAEPAPVEPTPAKPAPAEPVATGASSGTPRLRTLTQSATSEALNLIPEKLA